MPTAQFAWTKNPPSHLGCGVGDRMQHSKMRNQGQREREWRSVGEQGQDKDTERL